MLDLKKHTTFWAVFVLFGQKTAWRKTPYVFGNEICQGEMGQCFTYMYLVFKVISPKP